MINPTIFISCEMNGYLLQTSMMDNHKSPDWLVLKFGISGNLVFQEIFNGTVRNLYCQNHCTGNNAAVDCPPGGWS